MAKVVEYPLYTVWNCEGNPMSIYYDTLESLRVDYETYGEIPGYELLSITITKGEDNE